MTVRRLGALICASLVLAVVWSIPAPAEAQRARGLPACDPDNGGLILPEGFCALVVADGLEGARHVDVTANGDIYVHLRGSRGAEPNPPGGGARSGMPMVMAAPRSSSASPTTTVPVCSSAGTICISRLPPRCIGIG
jgi:hypothetical protein